MRSALLAVAVFAATTLLGACLAVTTGAGDPGAGARPVAVESPVASDHRSAADAAESARARADGGEVDHTVAHSLIYAGAGALLISAVGMVVVVHQRRRW